MTYPPSPYLEQRNGGLYIAGSRVSLDSVVINFQEGATPEQIVESFPTLKLANVYGAIAYYLEHEEMVKEYIAEGERELRKIAKPLSEVNPELWSRIQAVLASKRS